MKNYEKTLVELKENLKDLVREFAAVDLINYQGFLLDDYQPKMSYQKFRNEIEDLIEEGSILGMKLLSMILLMKILKIFIEHTQMLIKKFLIKLKMVTVG